MLNSWKHRQTLKSMSASSLLVTTISLRGKILQTGISYISRCTLPLTEFPEGGRWGKNMKERCVSYKLVACSVSAFPLLSV